jgi:hypothetical protein
MPLRASTVSRCDHRTDFKTMAFDAALVRLRIMPSESPEPENYPQLEGASRRPDDHANELFLRR